MSDDYVLQNLAMSLGAHAQPMPSHQPEPSAMPSHAPETTALSSGDEAKYRQWVQDNNIPDGPDSRYDMRGYWQDIASKGGDETQINDQDRLRHFPDTYKQHGHPTFSAESKYSRGPQDGGKWIGDTLVPPPSPSHVRIVDTSTGAVRLVPSH